MYTDGMGLYEVVQGNPNRATDPLGQEQLTKEEQRRRAEELERAVLPTFDPKAPNPVPPGTLIEQTIDDKGYKEHPPCGFIAPTEMKNCKGTVKFHVFCPAEEAVFARAGGDLCKMLEGKIQEAVKKGPGAGYPIKCPKGMRCCFKKRYDGQYPLNIVAREVSLSWSCSVSVTLKADIVAKGEVGQCYPSIIAGEQQ
jgi:hypothetical protein